MRWLSRLYTATYRLVTPKGGRTGTCGDRTGPRLDGLRGAVCENRAIGGPANSTGSDSRLPLTPLEPTQVFIVNRSATGPGELEPPSIPFGEGGTMDGSIAATTPPHICLGATVRDCSQAPFQFARNFWSLCCVLWASCGHIGVSLGPHEAKHLLFIALHTIAVRVLLRHEKSSIAGTAHNYSDLGGCCSWW